MLNRRNFIKNTSAILAASALPYQDIFAQLNMKQDIGIQLFSLPKLLDQDFAKGIEMLAKMGYKELEVFGPYPFSAKAAQESWDKVTPMLGFKGSGYFGKNINEIKSIFKTNGVTSPSAHTDIDTLLNNMDKLGEAAQVLGHKYVVLPAIPDYLRKTMDDYKRIAETFNKIGESAKKVGLKFGYHNHGYGIKPVNGQVPLQIILDQTDPNLVFFELDVYWTAAGGANPIDYLTKYPNRYKMLHLKDMKEKKTFSGDGSDAPQWIALFPYMTTAGDGVLDLKSIIAKAQSIGVEHYFVEQDMVANPEIALKRSFDYLHTV
jgi:sugar phosphate isomerase/epimerase